MQRSQIYICAGREASGQPPSEPKARLLAVVPEGAPSPLGRQVAVTSEDVMRHMARRLAFADPGFHLEVFTDAELQVGDKQMRLQSGTAITDVKSCQTCPRSNVSSCRMGSGSQRSGCSSR